MKPPTITPQSDLVNFGDSVGTQGTAYKGAPGNVTTVSNAGGVVSSLGSGNKAQSPGLGPGSGPGKKPSTLAPLANSVSVGTPTPRKITPGSQGSQPPQKSGINNSTTNNGTNGTGGTGGSGGVTGKSTRGPGLAQALLSSTPKQSERNNNNNNSSSSSGGNGANGQSPTSKSLLLPPIR